MEYRKLGRTGAEVSALGLGCMGMSDFYSHAKEAEDRNIGVIHRAVELGVNLLDSGDYYGFGHNELLIGRAIKEFPREKVFISVKFGALRNWDGNFLGVDTRPSSIRNFIGYSLQRLGTDHIDLYYPGRIDPNVPIEETVGTLAELVNEGKIRYVGLSEASAETVRRAAKVHPLAKLQTEYSLFTRDIETNGVLEACRELGVSIVAYSPLSRGLLTGAIKSADDLKGRDFRVAIPRFQGENLEKNLKIVSKLQEIAAEKGCSPSQLALAWLLSRGEDIIPIFGTRSNERLEENLGALKIELLEGDLTRIDQAAPVGAAAGLRYPEAAMRSVNA